jgi:hypothetical protein
MKNLKLWSLVVVVLVLVFTFFALNQFGEKSPIIAKGSLKLADELQQQAVGIRHVFITVFDAESNMPMPLGAMREQLDVDASGQFLTFLITPERLQMMNQGAPMPGKLRIKARLDLDGVGGSDQPGDITGQVTPVAFGSSEVEIILNNLVSN